LRSEAVVLAACLATACLPVIKRKDSKPELVEGDTNFTSTVQVKFLGVGGFMVRLGHDAFMTAPMYSNPFVRDVLPPEKPIPPDPGLIARYHHPTVHPEEIEAILVGHAHYDHLMDVALVWKMLAHRPPIFGSLTMRNILAGYDSSGGPVQAGVIVALDDVADYRQCNKPQPCEDCLPSDVCPTHSQTQAGTWRPAGSRIRVMALCAAHPKQFQDAHFWPGCVNTPRAAPPKYSCDYKEGQVFSYLIDFLDAQGTPVFRVYYQDTPSHATAGWGTIHADLLAERKVDLMLLCGGNWNVFDRSELVAQGTHAKNIVIGHWEDFFFDQGVPIHEIPGLDGEQFLARLKGVSGKNALVPEPQVMMHFPLS
jgi:hypothetical protein